LERWEPRLRLEQIKIDNVTAEGQISLSLVGYYLLNGQRIEIEGLVV
jgi:phage baseplate assembly protein W